MAVEAEIGRKRYSHAANVLAHTCSSNMSRCLRRRVRPSKRRVVLLTSIGEVIASAATSLKLSDVSRDGLYILPMSFRSFFLYFLTIR